jgi:hypothetical protein
MRLDTSGTDWQRKLRLSLSVDLARQSFEITTNGTLKLPNGLEINRFGVRRSGMICIVLFVLVDCLLLFLLLLSSSILVVAYLSFRFFHHRYRYSLALTRCSQH